MYQKAPKLSLLSATIAAALGVIVPTHEAFAADNTTLTTVITGSSQRTLNGYRKLVAQPNTASRVVRTLDGSAPVATNPSFSLLAFGHMSDTQICDDQSPARTPYLDKRNDIDARWGTDAAYRPHERLGVHMASAMVSSLRKQAVGPQTRLPLAFTLITGDMVDNSQYNETRNYINLMDGGEIWNFNWANPTVEEGPGYGGNDTAHHHNRNGWQGYGTKPSAYYHPDGNPHGANNAPPDWYMQHDFPRIPYLLKASRQKFVSPGLGMPWYAAFGNHDMAVQGNLPVNDGSYYGGFGTTLQKHATSSKRVKEIDLSWTKPDGVLDYASAIWDLGGLITGNYMHETRATPDPARAVLDKQGFIYEHFNTNGLPSGHGFNATRKPYYVIPSSGPNDRFKFIALDTTNPTGFGAHGWIDNAQWNWLVQELKAASSRYWNGSAWVANPAGKDKLIVLYGHHTLTSMDKITKKDGVAQGYTGEQLKKLLLNYPNVVMLVNGHTHSNKITAHPAKHGGKLSGFYEVTSPAAADFPVQSRLIEVGLATTGDANGSQNNDYLSIFTTMLDIDAPVAVDHNSSLSNFRDLASIGRELAFNDPGDLSGNRQKGWRLGTEADRNTQLILPTPFPMNDFPRLGSNGVHIVTQKDDTKDVKILRMQSDGKYSGTNVDFSGKSLQNSTIIGTGTFTQNVKGRNFGNDLVLRDAAGNIRIKLLDKDLNEVSYPGFGDTVRGTVASDTVLAGIGDFDKDGLADLVWRRNNGVIEVWSAGSILHKQYLNASNDNASATPEAGAAGRKIVAVGDFNGDGMPDLFFENLADRSRFTRFMNGMARVNDAVAPPNELVDVRHNYEIMPGVGRSTLGASGDHLLMRSMRAPTNGTVGTIATYSPINSGNQFIWYNNVAGSSANASWNTVGLGDFNMDGYHDVLWRNDDGAFAIWSLRNHIRMPFVGDYGFTAVGPEFKVKAVLKNTQSIIF
jgi:metallophosphoesterase (TIGR03767 family)